MYVNSYRCSPWCIFTVDLFYFLIIYISLLVCDSSRVRQFIFLKYIYKKDQEHKEFFCNIIKPGQTS